MFLLLFYVGISMAAKLVEVLPVDDRCLMLHFQDGYIEYNWDDTTSGSCNGWDYFHTETWSLCPDKDQYIAYGRPLDKFVVRQPINFALLSDEDENFGDTGKNPVSVHRKSKVWEAGHDENKPAMHHWIYLMLPASLQRGKAYTLHINTQSNTDQSQYPFVFDEADLESPAIKISNIGYEADAPHKCADVYLWMGDGGERDFKRLEGSTWYLYDTQSEKQSYSGTLQFRMANRAEPKFGKDFTMADVWECDFSSFQRPGEYKLVVEGIGCSPVFTIGDNRFEEAFKTAMQGMFYQRMGCAEKPAGDFPKARRPLFKQGVGPAGFKVEISNKEMVTGKNPDDRNWYSEDLSGNTARATWGGWCDAYDNDQRPVNFICVFDLLLTYYLNPEAFTDNQLYIPETGNGIPDIIDEALWEIDWWLRMRGPQGGYLTGLTNIRPPENTNYAGAACAWQGWCVAAGCAMAADCFRLAGLPELQAAYTDSAVAAYNWARGRSDKMLDVKVGDLRGRDLKMTAAAFLFNLTGSADYEDVIQQESKATDPGAKIRGGLEQQYATIAYILTPHNIRYHTLQSLMKAALINQAKTDYVDGMEDSPTKAARWAVGWEGMCQTSNEMSLVAIAHRITKSSSEKRTFERGLYAEAEWTLGRNPMGLVQMTGLTDRCFTQTFAPGRRDGYPGVTPGWTPFMCRDGWKNSNHIVRCEWYTSRNYPAEKEDWPWGEHFWNSRYNVPNAEATPQQTFRQKIVLYGYLYALNSRKSKSLNHDDVLESRYKLVQNYPNPFNDKTTIEFDLPIAAHTEIRVYNISGQVVDVLLNKRKEKGCHAVQWDGKNKNDVRATSGVYIVRMKANDIVRTQKMSFVK